MRLHKIKALILDLDDTLLVEEQSALLAFKSCAELVARHYPIAADAFIKQARACARELWYSLPTIAYAKQTGISSWEALWARFTGNTAQMLGLRRLKKFYRSQTWLHTLAHFGIEDRRLAGRCVRKFVSTRRKLHILFEDTLPFLSAIHGKYKLALITNGIPDLQQFKLKKSGLARFFEVITISGELGTAKPDPKLFDHTLTQLGIRAREAVMIGNSLNSDIKGAQAAGIFSIWLRRSQDDNGSTESVKPDYQVKTLNHVLSLLSTS
ncbi:MAG: HAD family hydrolase [Spirochaetales bacterium]|nr:HAD family hydrolase [Spirochaetales bacterium]